MKNLEIIPVNHSCLVREISKEEFQELLAPEPTSEEERELDKEGLKKIGSGALVAAKEAVMDPSDPDIMVNYCYGIVEKINEKEELPYDIRLGDYVVYNHGAVAEWDKVNNIKKKTVRFSEVVVMYREKNKKKDKK